MKITFKTAESVCEGHPDKLCDKIADAVLDAYLYKDKGAHVAVEVMAVGHRIIVAGEITSTAKVNIQSVVWRVLDKVGMSSFWRLVQVYVRKQSPDIAGGVNRSLENRNGDTSWYSSLGAGDQGTVYGYAIKEAGYEYLPLPLVFAHDICRKLDSCRKSGLIHSILPDGKAQVTIEYHDGKPARVKNIVVSIQHKPEVELEQLRSEVIANVLWPVFEKFPFDEETEILVNPSGRFVKGGPDADTGLTGRKLMVDTYGGLAHHGGGALSGKDPTKVDRSGAYMARYIARNVVSAGLATECEVSISYAIGKADPVSFTLTTFGTGRYPDDAIRKACLDSFNMRPAAIIEKLHLRNPGYEETATYGHFNGLRTWENSMTIQEDYRLEEVVKKYAN